MDYMSAKGNKAVKAGTDHRAEDPGVQRGWNAAILTAKSVDDLAEYDEVGGHKKRGCKAKSGDSVY
jgi:hypothetical protein